MKRVHKFRNRQFIQIRNFKNLLVGEENIRLSFVIIMGSTASFYNLIGGSEIVLLDNPQLIIK